MTNPYRIRELKVEVNKNCPLTCLHCSSNGAPRAPEELPPTRVADLIQEFVRLGGEKLVISGGEPLSYQSLPDILDVCCKCGVETQIYTTGISMNDASAVQVSEEILSQISDSRAKIVLSLHGATEETHDKLTQVQGSFRLTMAAMERALAKEIAVEVHIVPTAMNIQEIGDITALLDTRDIRKISWLRFVPQGRGQLHRDSLQLTNAQFRELMQLRPELQRRYPRIQIRAGSPFNVMVPESPTPCSAGLEVLVVRPDGYAVPCDAFKQFKGPDGFGNILVHSLQEVWDRSAFLNCVRRLLESRPNSPCASCRLYRSCNSGCIAQKAIAAGILMDGKDPDCLLERGEVDSGKVEAVSVC
jgi:radical SAM protein with 4Fe4S-binding SPASM domain